MSQPPPDAGDITYILRRVSGGHSSAAAELFPLVYNELRALAAVWFRRPSPDQTLQPTALVHEAYVKLVGHDGADWNDRNHFFVVAAKAIRQVLIDHARQRATAKRGGAFKRIAIEDAEHAAPASREIDILALDEALAQLAELDPRKSHIVELRVFGGLTGDAIAAALGISRNTVDRDWQVARAWLRTQLRDHDG